MTATASCNLSGKHTGGERPYRWVSQQMHIKVFTKKRIYFEESLKSSFHCTDKTFWTTDEKISFPFLTV